MESKFQFGRRVGAPQMAGDAQITPESFVLLLRIGSFGCVWNWPIAVSVARAGGGARPGSAGGAVSAAPIAVERHAIIDVTRIALWGMGAVTLLMAPAAFLVPLWLRAGQQAGKRDGV